MRSDTPGIAKDLREGIAMRKRRFGAKWYCRIIEAENALRVKIYAIAESSRL